jgi:small subunit ribosomal protein S16
LLIAITKFVVKGHKTMAVTIRFSRLGKKNRPYWRIVAVDSSKKRDGAFLEDLGTYDPVKHVAMQLDTDRVKAWLAQGAQCSDAVRKLIRVQTSAKA